ncbi:hypothetical protein C1645_841636, partial [Glomus cerebriforme]
MESLHQYKGKGGKYSVLKKSPADTDVENIFVGEELEPSWEIAESFQNPPKEYIHIIVQPPPATTGLTSFNFFIRLGKRKAEEDKENGSRKKGKSEYPSESKEGRDNEIQVIYGNRANYFWSKVKMLMSSECKNDIHILLFGTYDPILMDEVTPVKFSDNNTLSLKSLLLAEEELKDLIRFYVRIRVLGGSPLFKIPQKVEDSIFSLTEAEKSDKTLTIGMIRYLASPSLTINVMK